MVSNAGTLSRILLPGGRAFLFAQVDSFTQVNQVPLQDIAAVFAQVDHLRAQHDFVQPGNRRWFYAGDLNVRENVGNGLAQEVFPVRVGSSPRRRSAPQSTAVSIQVARFVCSRNSSVR